MVTSIDLAKNQAQVLWQQTRAIASKMANKVDKATLAKIARVAGPVLAVLMVLYVINALLKRKDIDAGKIVLQQFEEFFKKLKNITKQILIFQPANHDKLDLEQGTGKNEREELALIPTGGDQQIIHQGRTVFLKQGDRTLDVALVIKGLQIAVQFTLDEADPTQFNPIHAFIKGNGMISPQALGDIYASIQLPHGFHLAQPSSNLRKMASLISPRVPLVEQATPPRVSRVEQVNQELLSSSIIIRPTRLPNLAAKVDSPFNALLFTLRFFNSTLPYSFEISS